MTEYHLFKSNYIEWIVRWAILPLYYLVDDVLFLGRERGLSLYRER